MEEKDYTEKYDANKDPTCSAIWTVAISNDPDNFATEEDSAFATRKEAEEEARDILRSERGLYNGYALVGLYVYSLDNYLFDKVYTLNKRNHLVEYDPYEEAEATEQEDSDLEEDYDDDMDFDDEDKTDEVDDMVIPGMESDDSTHYEFEFIDPEELTYDGTPDDNAEQYWDEDANSLLVALEDFIAWCTYEFYNDQSEASAREEARNAVDTVCRSNADTLDDEAVVEDLEAYIERLHDGELGIIPAIIVEIRADGQTIFENYIF